MYDKGTNPGNNTLENHNLLTHGPPSSLLIEAIAATQGVYNKQNIKSDSAPRGVSIVIKRFCSFK